MGRFCVEQRYFLISCRICQTDSFWEFVGDHIMKMEITKEDVWAASIDDRPGGLADKLDVLDQAGVNLEFIIARRAPDKPGTGVVFVTAIKGAKGKKAAQSVGFSKTDSLHSIRIACPDKSGRGAELTGQLAEAGINLRGFSGAAIGKKAVFHLAFDYADDAKKAIQVLRKL